MMLAAPCCVFKAAANRRCKSNGYDFGKHKSSLSMANFTQFRGLYCAIVVVYAKK